MRQRDTRDWLDGAVTSLRLDRKLGSGADGERVLFAQVRGAFLVLVVALLLGLVPTTAQGAFPGKRGRIAFDREVGRSTYIYTARPSGKDVKRLPCTARDSDGNCQDSGPVWSATGRRIALSNATGLALMDPDGSAVVQIPISTFSGLELFIDDEGPAISPSGKKLSFAADDEDSTAVGRPGDIYVVNTNGTGLDSLVSESFSPAWSSTGRIAFASGGIFVRRRGGMPLVVYGQEADDPAWGPRARRIAFSCDEYESICSRRANGKGRVRRLIPDRPGDNRQRTNPAWSPDRRYLLYQRFTSANNVDVVVWKLRRGPVHTIQNARNPDWQPRP